MNSLVILVDNQLTIYLKDSFWTLHSIPLVDISIFVLFPRSFLITVVCSKIWNEKEWVFQLFSIYHDIFDFHMNFRMDFSFWKTVIKILIWISLNLKIILGVINIFATLSISIHEHEISFQLFLFPLILLNSVFYMTVFKSFSWLSIFLSIFLFDVILMELFSLFNFFLTLLMSREASSA